MKVLVADDDPGSLLVAQAAVERAGHDCLAAANGDEAWWSRTG
jgi:CheY-like chemotaxis protein